MPAGEIVVHATAWRSVVLVCRKCSKKLGGGFGRDGADSLARALKRELRGTGTRGEMRVLDAKCFGLCPKRGVTVLAGRNPGVLLAVPAGMEVGRVLARVAGDGVGVDEGVA